MDNWRRSRCALRSFATSEQIVMRLLLFNTRSSYRGKGLTKHLTIVRYSIIFSLMTPQDDSLFRVLCVEDNPTFQHMLKLALGRYGLEVITASHGVDALMQYKAHSGQFASIISDNDLPHMNGLEFVRAVREMGYKGRIVIMSGRLTVEELHAYEPHGISGFFSKPFEVGVLAALLLQSE
jgi:CheY-like chemotaxis protein